MKNWFLLILFFCGRAYAQNGSDTLWLNWKNTDLSDSIRLKSLDRYVHLNYLFSNPDSAIILSETGLKFAQDKKNIKGEAALWNTIGIANAIMGNNETAIGYFEKCRIIYTKTGDQSGIASSINNQALIYSDMGESTKALELFNKSLQIYRDLGDQDNVASSLGNIGIVYHNMGNYKMAIEHYMQKLKVSEAADDETGIAIALNNIGIVYYDQGDYAKAEAFFNRGLEINEREGNKQAVGLALNYFGNIRLDQHRYEEAVGYYNEDIRLYEEIGDRQGIAIAYNNLGNLYVKLQQPDSALWYYFESVKISKEIENNVGISQPLNNISNIYYDRGEYEKAMKFSTEALSLAQSFGQMPEIRDAARSLYEIYKIRKDYRQALEMMELFIANRDSVQSDENQRSVIEQLYKYEYEKQAATDSIKNAEQQKVKDAQIAKQDAELHAKNILQYMLFGGLTLVIVFAGFMYNRFKVTKQQKIIIEEQKHIVEEKNKEITDSITYAKRIQNAILPSDKAVKEFFPESFVLYKPKDIVAGDFYWLSTLNKSAAADCIYFAACDCTGHGVPGAMVSVVCHNALNRSVKEFGMTEPGKILDKTRELVIAEFEKSDEEVKDGMDISLLSIEGNKLCWSGANNPLWIIRKGKLTEYKPDKQPIGKYAEAKPFTTHEIMVESGDLLYVFTDGFQDQFGGEKGKKYKTAGFKQLLLSVHNKSMEEQKQFLNQSFENWKNDLEQNDDVCVLGIRVV